MILINDATDGNAFIPEDVFEEIAESVLTNLKDRRGIGQELEQVEYSDPETYVEIVEEAANTIHKGITEFVDANFLKSDKNVDSITLSFGVARAELKTLFHRNMKTVASI